jgi:hypothetical protein
MNRSSIYIHTIILSYYYLDVCVILYKYIYVYIYINNIYQQYRNQPCHSYVYRMFTKRANELLTNWVDALFASTASSLYFALIAFT